MVKQVSITSCKILLAITVLGLSSLVQAQSIGKVLVSAGTVRVERSGNSLPLGTGAPVESGDTVVTGRESHTQIRFLDESVVALRPDSRFRIDEFRYQGQQDGSETGFFTLLKGGMRKITGFVGKLNADRYKLATSQATIGIRGTDFEIALCENDLCQDANGQIARNGFYCGVYEGEVASINQYGASNWRAGAFFYIADTNSPAERIIGTPYFLGASFQAKAFVGATALRAVDRPRVPHGEAQSTTVNVSPLDFRYVQAEISSGQKGPQTALIGSDQYILELASQGEETKTPLALTYDTAGGLSSFHNANLTASRGAASLLDRGSAIDAGNLNWGRWAGVGSNITAQLGDGSVIRNNDGNLHYVYGDIARDLPTSGQAVYTPVGWTTPTDALSRQTGSMLSGGTINVDFTHAALNLNNLTVVFAGGTYTLSGGAYMVDGIFSSVASPNPATISCNGTCQAALSGTFGGFFAGRTGSGVGLDYNLNLSPALIEGVVGYRRSK